MSLLGYIYIYDLIVINLQLTINNYQIIQTYLH
jgi:hypothetical protein